MKKTLIALMALAGIACGAETLTGITAQFTTPPTTADDYWVNDYVFEFTLTEDYTLSDFGSVLAVYWGDQATNSTAGEGYSCGAIYLTESNGVLTLNIGDGITNENLSNVDITSTTTFTNQRGTTFSTVEIQTGVTYTLSVTGANQDMTPTLTWEGESVTAAVFNGNMNGGNSGNATTNYKVNVGTVTIPEPATATLSLLALAGLAARRRRK